jgi:hypothetical protein
MAAVRFKVVETDGQEIVHEIHKVVVHTFTMGDVEDPDLYAAEPMWKWQDSEQGKFVMEHAVDQPEWHRQLDHTSYGYKYAITAELEAKKLSEFYLRWGEHGSGKIR